MLRTYKKFCDTGFCDREFVEIRYPLFFNLGMLGHEIADYVLTAEFDPYQRKYPCTRVSRRFKFQSYQTVVNKICFICGVGFGGQHKGFNVATIIFHCDAGSTIDDVVKEAFQSYVVRDRAHSHSLITDEQVLNCYSAYSRHPMDNGSWLKINRYSMEDDVCLKMPYWEDRIWTPKIDVFGDLQYQQTIPIFVMSTVWWQQMREGINNPGPNAEPEPIE